MDQHNDAAVNQGSKTEGPTGGLVSTVLALVMILMIALTGQACVDQVRADQLRPVKASPELERAAAKLHARMSQAVEPAEATESR